MKIVMILSLIVLVGCSCKAGRKPLPKFFNQCVEGDSSGIRGGMYRCENNDHVCYIWDYYDAGGISCVKKELR